jgi:hypothetical protein
VQRAESFNHPLLTTPIKSNANGALPPEGSLLSLDADNVIVTGVKRAEDDEELVVRFYEAYGKSTKVTAKLATFDTGKVTTVNFIEDKLADESGLSVQLRPHEIRTLKFCGQGEVAPRAALQESAMRRWLQPTASGVMLFVLLLAFEGLCGDTTSAIETGAIRQSVDDPPRKHTVTTFGAPIAVEWHEISDEPARNGLAVRPLPLIGVVVVGWALAVCLGRLMLDGGASVAERTLLPPRRNPGFWLTAYVAVIPVLALPGLAVDLLHGGVRGLGSPDGPSTFPLCVMAFLLYGTPVLAIVLAVRRGARPANGPRAAAV